MTKSMPRIRALRFTTVICLFAAIIVGPQAFKVPHFAGSSLVRSLAAQVPANYTYTLIADGTSCSNLGSPVLNNAGQVAFWEGPCFAPVGPGVVVRRWDGSGPLTDIYTFTSGKR